MTTERVLPPILAQRSLDGAAAHLLRIRSELCADDSARRTAKSDMDFYDSCVGVTELAFSTLVYTASLVWWAYPGPSARSVLIEKAGVALLDNVDRRRSAAVMRDGYQTVVRSSARAVAATSVDGVISEVDSLVLGLPGVDTYTCQFAESLARTVMLVDPRRFGHRDVAAARMLEVMRAVAYGYRDRHGTGDGPSADRVTGAVTDQTPTERVERDGVSFFDDDSAA